MVALRSLTDDEMPEPFGVRREPIDLGALARDLTVAHAGLLRAEEPVTVTALLVEIGRCPSCTRPLIRGDRVAYCSECGSQVDRC